MLAIEHLDQGGLVVKENIRTVLLLLATVVVPSGGVLGDDEWQPAGARTRTRPLRRSRGNRAQPRAVLGIPGRSTHGRRLWTLFQRIEANGMIKHE